MAYTTLFMRDDEWVAEEGPAGRRRGMMHHHELVVKVDIRNILLQVTILSS
jgi:hypothetical protein